MISKESLMCLLIKAVVLRKERSLIVSGVMRDFIIIYCLLGEKRWAKSLLTFYFTSDYNKLIASAAFISLTALSHSCSFVG